MYQRFSNFICSLTLSQIYWIGVALICNGIAISQETVLAAIASELIILGVGAIAYAFVYGLNH